MFEALRKQISQFPLHGENTGTKQNMEWQAPVKLIHNSFFTVQYKTLEHILFFLI